MNKKINYQKGEMEFLVMILVFIVIVFIIWVLTGGKDDPGAEKPFIIPGNDPEAPLQVYGPGERPN